ncbi:MAG TPA: alpha/beta hydrolase [Magnetospirillaceae bacterium]|nr:alpha/beta hydrolase [Magnetospirillaceae bacterium]
MRRRSFLIGSAALLAGAALRPPAFAAAPRNFASLPQGRIAYIDRGRGPVVLFLHGFPLSSFQWRDAISRLSDTRRCLAPDWMGLGRTEVAPGQSVTPSAQADMLAAFLDHLGVKEVDIVANDSGGQAAQLFLTRYRSRVKSLLLTNCDTEIDSPPPAVLPIIELARAGIYPELYLEPWLNHKDEARASTGLGGMCFSNPANPTDEALDEYLGPLVSSPERKALINRYALGLFPNPLAGIADQLRECKLPTRIVWGMGDTIFSPKSPDYLASLMPQATIRRLDKAKLFWPEEYPEIIVEEARRLWAV